jgi:hypothetical protein
MMSAKTDAFMMNLTGRPARREAALAQPRLQLVRELGEESRTLVRRLKSTGVSLAIGAVIAMAVVLSAAVIVASPGGAR